MEYDKTSVPRRFESSSSLEFVMKEVEHAPRALQVAPERIKSGATGLRRHLFGLLE